MSRRHVLQLSGGAVTVLLVGCSTSGDDAAEVAEPASTTTSSSAPSTTGEPTTSTAPTTTEPIPADAFEPVGHLITRWRGDRFARGSYSYVAKGSRPVDRSTLGASIDDRVFFAGEAVNRDYPATVHGAYLSGIDAADEVVASGAEEVVIVGAGASGLAAAASLREAGVSVRILEGRSWVGGRVHTNNSLGAALDLGASWIHGIDGNVLTELADEAGILRVESDYDDFVVYDDAGRIVADTPADYDDVVDIENEYAADVDDLSRDAFIEGAEYRGADVLFPNGYSELMEFIAKGADIELSTAVTAIEHDDTGVTVRTESGATHTADAVVVTVPLGVLKAGSIDFDPPLPADKLDVIDRLGMGHLAKVFLRFEEAFWPEDVEFFGYLGPERDRFPYWANMLSVTGEPILLAFHGGSAADALEAQDDEAVIAEAIAVLRQMFGAT